MAEMGIFAGSTPFGSASSVAQAGEFPERFPERFPKRIPERSPERILDRPSARLAARFLDGLRSLWRVSTVRQPPRLKLVERVSLGPRQALLLVEADGARLLVATSADGPPAFCPLSAAVSPPRLDSLQPAPQATRRQAKRPWATRASERISW